MKIIIIGAGFAGLALAESLSHDTSIQIEVLDPNPMAGGLALGVRRDEWEWSAEQHYHHAFDTDQALKQFVSRLGLSKDLFYKKVKSSTLYKGKIYQVDSALSLLRFDQIPLLDRLRTGLVLAFLKLWPKGQQLEGQQALTFLRQTCGAKASQVLWEPLFAKKFGRFAEEINLAWFWGRIHPRTPRLGYFKGGWQSLADLATAKLRDRGVVFRFQTSAQRISKQNQEFVITVSGKDQPTRTLSADIVISTLPAPHFSKLIDLPELKAAHLQGLGAMTLLLRLRQKLLTDGSYWLNINDKKWPFLAVVEHDNFIAPKRYGDEKLVYVGRYLDSQSSDFQKSTAQLLEDYDPYLSKLNKQWRQHLISAEVYKAPFAQPISGINQSRRLPKFDTSVPNLYWVSMQHVYPFDRGVNYAIAAAWQLAKHVKINSLRHA